MQESVKVHPTTGAWPTGVREARDAWVAAIRQRGFVFRALIASAGLYAGLWIFGDFVSQVEVRPGVLLADPVLAMFEPHDVTYLTFALIYGSILVALIYLFTRPGRLVMALQAYTIMVFFRMLMMYSVPLEAPAKIIPLVDPLVESIAQSKTLLKDLFFSGHTSTQFLLFLTVRHRILRPIFLLGTVLVGGCVLIQHVHYFVDVVAAPFFAYGSYRLSLKLNRSILS